MGHRCKCLLRPKYLCGDGGNLWLNENLSGKLNGKHFRQHYRILLNKPIMGPLLLPPVNIKAESTTMTMPMTRNLRYFGTPFESKYAVIRRSSLRKTAVTPLALEKWKRENPELAEFCGVP